MAHAGESGNPHSGRCASTLGTFGRSDPCGQQGLLPAEGAGYLQPACVLQNQAQHIADFQSYVAERQNWETKSAASGKHMASPRSEEDETISTTVGSTIGSRCDTKRGAIWPYGFGTAFLTSGVSHTGRA